ncbi:MAG TPA: 30S ribosomal protein S16 [Firmicutes bacterium]|nr:30S ribosomal protein S16 [Candidatus Fermentithermobacillaceae bacterium]
MPAKIRLKRIGSKKAPVYRIVVMDSRSPRDGRSIDEIGYYNPRTEPPTFKVEEEKAILWLRRGAQPTPTAKSLLTKAGVIERWQALRKEEGTR